MQILHHRLLRQSGELPLHARYPLAPASPLAEGAHLFSWVMTAALRSLARLLCSAVPRAACASPSPSHLLYDKSVVPLLQMGKLRHTRSMFSLHVLSRLGYAIACYLSETFPNGSVTLGESLNIPAPIE